MWRENCRFTPRSFKEIIGKMNSQFLGNNQHDCQELLGFIMSRIHEETCSEVKIKFNVSEDVKNFIKIKSQYMKIMNNTSISDFDKMYSSNEYNDYIKHHKNDSIIADAYNYWEKYIVKSNSIITDLFTGLFFSKVKCKECNNETYTFDPFTILSIEVDSFNDKTLDECLYNFTKEEPLINDEKYNCNICKKYVEATKQIQIMDLPDVLIIQLKRFKYNKDSDSTTKISTTIKFPFTNFDIKKYTSDVYMIKNTIYSLYAVSNHMGTCNCGHYTSYCKNEINNKWYEFDDENIIHIPSENLEKEIITDKAYILFYKRQLNNDN
jgi:ubiquitin C-terminal hydrolase